MNERYDIMNVTIEKTAGKRMGIFLESGTRWGAPIVVRTEAHVQNVRVNDVITHVDGRRYWSTRRVAAVIIEKGPYVTLTVKRRELACPLLIESPLNEEPR